MKKAAVVLSVLVALLIVGCSDNSSLNSPTFSGAVSNAKAIVPSLPREGNLEINRIADSDDSRYQFELTGAMKWSLQQDVTSTLVTTYIDVLIKKGDKSGLTYGVSESRIVKTSLIQDPPVVRETYLFETEVGYMTMDVDYLVGNTVEIYRVAINPVWESAGK